MHVHTEITQQCWAPLLAAVYFAILKQELSLAWRLPAKTRLTGQQAPNLCLSLSPPSWDLKHGGFVRVSSVIELIVVIDSPTSITSALNVSSVSGHVIAKHHVQGLLSL